MASVDMIDNSARRKDFFIGVCRERADNWFSVVGKDKRESYQFSGAYPKGMPAEAHHKITWSN